MIVHRISCLLWNSTRSSRRDAGERTGDGGSRDDGKGLDSGRDRGEVRQAREEEARQSIGMREWHLIFNN